MSSRLKKRVMSALAVSGLCLAGLAISAVPAQAAGGTVTCTTSTVVGMWIDVDGGTDGFATLSGSGNSKSWSYNTQGKRWRAFVGCGGTSQTWGQSIESNWTTLQGGTVSCADTGYIRVCRVG